MDDLLSAFDAMVLKAFRNTDDIESMLKSDAFWEEVDILENKLAREEDLTKLEIKLRREYEQLEREMKSAVLQAFTAPSQPDQGRLQDDEAFKMAVHLRCPVFGTPSLSMHPRGLHF